MKTTKKTNKHAELPKPIIALDYDGTITLNVPFWVDFINRAEMAGFAVAIVTMRYPEEKESMDHRILAHPWIITTERHAKREFCAAFGVHPAIWIDDQPNFILFDAADARTAPVLDVGGIQALRAAQDDLKEEFKNNPPTVRPQ